MALKPTIFKFEVSLSDIDRHYYDQLSLTVAQHPSETAERMMVRVLAYCLNADELLSFTKGLSTPDEPDIEQRSLDGQLLAWIDVGEPKFERIKKATRLASSVSVYTFNSKSDAWWQQVCNQFNTANVKVYGFDWGQIQLLVGILKRTVSMNVTIQEQSILVSTDSASHQLDVKRLSS